MNETLLINQAHQGWTEQPLNICLGRSVQPCGLRGAESCSRRAASAARDNDRRLQHNGPGAQPLQHTQWWTQLTPAFSEFSLTFSYFYFFLIHSLVFFFLYSWWIKHPSPIFFVLLFISNFSVVCRYWLGGPSLWSLQTRLHVMSAHSTLSIFNQHTFTELVRFGSREITWQVNTARGSIVTSAAL